MSAETLRRAAALMRDRAEAARSFYAEHHAKAGQEVPWFGDADLYDFDDGDGPHIVGMSPAVALAMAGLIEAELDHPFGPCEQTINLCQIYLANEPFGPERPAQ